MVLLSLNKQNAYLKIFKNNLPCTLNFKFFNLKSYMNIESSI